MSALSWVVDFGDRLGHVRSNGAMLLLLLLLEVMLMMVMVMVLMVVWRVADVRRGGFRGRASLWCLCGWRC